MSGFSTAYTKKDFLKYMEDQISDNEVIIISTYVNNFELKKKQGSKNVGFQFPSKGFRNVGVVNDIMESKNVAIIIADKKILDDAVLKDLKTQ